MSMRAPAKYLFDNDFARGGESRPTVALAEHAAKLKDAEDAAFNRGFAAASAEAAAAVEARSAAALERVAAAVESFDRGLSVLAARLEREAVEVAVAVGKKLASELLARAPLTEIAALASECFRHLVATPHVAVRVNDALYQLARGKLDGIVRSLGLESRLVVLGEPDIAPGDCRIEWADGGIIRNSALTAAAIDDAVKRYLNARPAGEATSDTAWRSDR